MTENHSALWREYLLTADLVGIRRLWAHMMPHLPQPNGDFEVQVMMHSARTQAEFLPHEVRLYSHDWLIANDLPSLLPDRLKRPSDQQHNRFAKGVGIAVMTDDPGKRPLAKVIEKAMSDAVEDAFAHGHTETGFLRDRMADARHRALAWLGRPKINVTARFNGLLR